MNKKAEILTILIVVLVTSSMASGLILVVGDGTTFTDPGDEITIDIGDTIWIGIYDYIGEMYDARILSFASLEGWTGNAAIYSPPAISTAPGWTHEINGSNEWWDVDLSDPGSTETPLPGVGCETYFPIYLNMWPGGFEDELLLNVVPEPTTVLLLALGGLALTRRRK